MARIAVIHVLACNIITIMYGPEGNSCFPRVLMFPDTKSRETSGPECFVIYLDFPLNNHIAKTNKQIRRAGNNCSIVSRSGYI